MRIDYHDNTDILDIIHARGRKECRVLRATMYRAGKKWTRT